MVVEERFSIELQGTARYPFAGSGTIDLPGTALIRVSSLALSIGENMSRARTVALGAILAVGLYLSGTNPVFPYSASYCDNYARNYADRVSWNSSRGGALGGATRGAAGGALFGAIGGNAGMGAAVGAGVGAIVGGARRSNNWSANYDRAYRDCRRGVR